MSALLGLQRTAMWVPLSAAACLVACSSDDGGQPACDQVVAFGESPAECIDWEEVAVDRGFDPAPSDFFRFLVLGCSVELDDAVVDLDELVAASDAIVVGRLEAIDPVPVEDRGEVVEYEGELSLRVDETVAGSPPAEIRVAPSCTTAGKIAGLRSALPDDRFLFLLEALSDGSDRFVLAYFYLGVVVAGATGPRFAIPGTEVEGPSLAPFSSLDDLVDALRDR